MQFLWNALTLIVGLTVSPFLGIYLDGDFQQLHPRGVGLDGKSGKALGLGLHELKEAVSKLEPEPMFRTCLDLYFCSSYDCLASGISLSSIDASLRSIW